MVLESEIIADGWLIDHGDLFGEKVGTSGVVEHYGWRCTPGMSYPSEASADSVELIDHFFIGHTVHIGEYVDPQGVRHSTCPDGSPNVWEMVVADGLYTVTVGHSLNHAQPAFASCTFENVARHALPKGVTAHTMVFTAEVSDGRFTIGSALQNAFGSIGINWEYGPCTNVNWIKLDLVSSQLQPSPFLPIPQHEWWQMDRDFPEDGVGLVSIALPHTNPVTHAMYNGPSNHQRRMPIDRPDCRRWWLYGPARCHQSAVEGAKIGSHPDLAQYPDWPGFTEAYLAAFFDDHDTDGNGILEKEEFKAASQHSTFTSTGDFDWDWDQLRADQFWDSRVSYNVTIARAEFITGWLSEPGLSWCNPFERHSRHGESVCRKTSPERAMREGTDRTGLNRGPYQLGNFSNDGAHGFVVAVSDTPCSDSDGCTASGANITVCEVVTATYLDDKLQHRIDCRGARGQYLQIWLPGEGSRVFSVLNQVTVHAARLPPCRDGNPADMECDPGPLAGTAETPSAADPNMSMVCYGVEAIAPPDAADPNLLAETKVFPQLLATGPEDPIWFSSCLMRAIIKTWLPLGESGESGESGAVANPWQFEASDSAPSGLENYCLSCDAYETNYINEQAAGYNITEMPTRHWFLQPNNMTGCCVDCETSQISSYSPAGYCSPDAVTVTVIWGFDVSAASITVTRGDSVRWIATEGEAGLHDVVSGTRTQGQADIIDGGFNSQGLLQAGESGGFVHSFLEAGNYTYFCSPHASMVATISVVDAATPSPTSSPTPSSAALCFNEPATSFCHSVRKYWGTGV